MDKVRIKNFTEVITGGTPSTSKSEFWENGNIPWLNSGELNQKIVTSSRNYITKLGLEKSSSRLMPKDTVLIALTGSTTGVVGYLTFEACANQSVTGILPSENHNSKYLYYYLNSIRPKVLSDAYGGAQPHISQGYVKELEIPLPALATQQRIDAILEKSDAIIQNNSAIVQKYDALTQSLFLDMFGDIKSNSKNWDLKPFEYFAKFDTKMTSDFEKYADKPHIGIANIEKETGKLVDYKLISEENLSSGKYIFDESHIIYSKIRPNLNKVALPNFSGLCSADSYPLKVISKNTNRIFFAYVLRSDSFVDFILTHSTRTNIPKANKEQMKKYIGIAPPIELQNQFAERVAVIEAQKQQAQLALSKSEALFLSLLQRAFKGELN